MDIQKIVNPCDCCKSLLPLIGMGAHLRAAELPETEYVQAQREIREKRAAARYARRMGYKP
jgi:hypothetical protein